MRSSQRTMTVLGIVMLVGVACVAMASIALARADGGGAGGGGGGMLSGSPVVWGSVSGGGRGVVGETTPTISGVDPSVRAVGSAAFVMTVSGSSIVSTSTVLWNGVALATAEIPGASSIKATVPASLVGAGKVGTVPVKLSTGSKVSTQTVTFTVTQPTITSVSPVSAAYAAAPVEITLTGTHLKDGLLSPTLTLRGTGLMTGTTIATTGAVTQISDTSMKGTFSLTSPSTASAGVYDVVLSYGATGSVIKLAAFRINNPVPTLLTISPTTVYARSTQPLVLTVNGINFLQGVTGSAIKIGTRLTTNTTFVSAIKLTVPLTAADIAAVGIVPITVVNPAPGGGTSSAVNLTVAADTTAPITTIAGGDSAWHNTPVVLSVTATDTQSGVQQTQYAVNGVTPLTLVGGTITVPADGSMDGANTVEAWSTDWCGNVESPRPQVTVNIDTVGPKTSGTAPSTVNTGRKAKATFKYRANDVTPTCKIILKIKYKSSGHVARTYQLGSKSSNQSFKYTVKPNLAEGKYIFYVYATDQAGNTQSKLGTDTFKVK